jgi:RNA polymerase sigma-70 factor (ECF subfamily)
LLRMDRTQEVEALAYAARSFEEFFLEHRDGVYGALWLVTRDRQEAEEIAQDAFLKLWERWDRVGRLDDPEGYLYRTALNVWRSRRRRAAVALRKVVRPSRTEDALASVDANDVVIRALAVLTPKQRAAVVLTDLLDLTSEEAGNALGIRASTVRVLAGRGRGRLRQEMEDTR